MTISMRNFALPWFDANGAPRASAVAYSESGAEDRRRELEAAGANRVTVVPVKPGELPGIPG
jgi:hypothetical protein